jgi:tyrosyl-tRNA synthetase
MVAQVTSDDLGAKLATGPIAVYHGIDASADSLHVGNLIGVLVLRRLQAAGHRPVVLLGGGTTLIGDPSGKQSERPMRPADEVRANVEAIRAQVGRFLDLEQAEVVNNADWLTTTPLTDFLRDIGKHFTVNAMMAKESVRSRLEDREQGISFTEFSYMLLQAYDYLHLFDAFECRLQVGGSDQWGNITAGVDLVRRVRGAEVDGLTWPLLTKPDGSKFGKSEQGNVWLSAERTSPYEFFQFWMNADDAAVIPLLKLFADVSPERVASLEEVHAQRPEAREVHRVLAHEVTALVHGEAEAEAAHQASAALFGGALDDLSERSLVEAFSEAPSTVMSRSELPIPLTDLLVRTGVSPSRSAARRDVEQGGVYVNNQRAEGAERAIAAADLLHDRYLVLRRGKRTYHLVRFGE